MAPLRVDLAVETAAGVAQQLEHPVGGHVGGDESEIRLGSGGLDLLHGAAETEAAVADGRETVNGVDRSLPVAICRSTGGVKVERVRGLEGLAMEVGGSAEAAARARWARR